MSRLQTIENALSSINETVFQELCDSFLALRNSNYSAFSRTGSQSGKQKTIKGTPDTFLLLPNGKYIFVEYSTNITAGLNKLLDDIKKCIDTKKTGIPVNQIAEIILCVNFKLKAAEIQKLNALLTNTRIGLSVNTLDSLALELHLNHRDLTHEYLGLTLDTGQIVSIERFIAEYNKASKGISTPLDNTFLHREQELSDLTEAILKSDFVILTGAPGIGKTKLALECINKFLLENLNFEAYCVSYKHHTLLDDLYQYFDTEKDYILFVDDANRIDAFNQITGFYRGTRKGKLKILITVRDYAFQEVGMLCQEFSPRRLDLAKFSDEQILDIVKAKPFETVVYYHRQIVHIADGNPRLAIMAALLANAQMNIYALADVSDLFEKYFSTFVKDDGEFAKSINIQCLGLIAFFYTIPYKDREITTSILDNFGIDYSTFIDVIDKLDKLELVEIQFDHVKIPEQNLSTYFFYRSFIKDLLLSFETLLNKYFDSNSNRFRDCVIPANNTFGVKNVMDKLQPFLQSHWRKITKEEGKAFKFLSTFWLYLQYQTLEFICNIIDQLEPAITTKYVVTYENNAFSYKQNDVIELLGEFLRFPPNLKEALELGFEYTRKKPNHLPEWIHKIREHLIFDEVDQNQYHFTRQITLFNILLDGLSKSDALFSAAFYELSKTFLSFKFHHTKGGRNHSFYWYDFTIPNIPVIQNFRQNMWETIEQYFEVNPEESFKLLLSYSSVSPDVTKEIMEFDIPFLIKIIEKHLSKTSFEHCKYVHDQIRWCKRNSVTNNSFELLQHNFTNPTYEIFLKIDWDRFRDKEEYEFDDYREYGKLKETDIRNSFVFTNATQIKEFYSIFIYLKKATKNEWFYNTSLDYIIDENCSKNFNLGCLMLIEVIERKNESNYIPDNVFRNHLKTTEQTNKIWEILQKHEFNYKGLWMLSFYDYIDDSLLSKEYVELFLDTFKNIKESNTFRFDRIQRFLTIEPKLYEKILRIIVDKNENEGMKLPVWRDSFGKYFHELGDNIDLIKKAYLQQDLIDNHFDYEGEGFLNILKKDINFLIEYVDSLYSRNHFGTIHGDKNLGFIWHVENIEPILSKVFDLVIVKEPYLGILDHFCNSFFKNLEGESVTKAKTFLFEYCKASYRNSDKMNIIIDIVRHSMNELFEDMLIYYLSLTQDKKIFSEIWWRGNGGSYVGYVITGDIEAAEWKNILSIVEKSNKGFRLIQIKKYLNDKIEQCLKHGDWERQRRFLERY